MFVWRWRKGTGWQSTDCQQYVSFSQIGSMSLICRLPLSTERDILPIWIYLRNLLAVTWTGNRDIQKRLTVYQDIHTKPTSYVDMGWQLRYTKETYCLSRFTYETYQLSGHILTHWYTDSLIYSVTHWYTDALMCWLIGIQCNSLIYWLMDDIQCDSLIYWLINKLTH